MQKGYFGSENLMVQKHTQQHVPSVGGFSIGLLGREPPSFVSAQRYFMQYVAERRILTCYSSCLLT